MAEAPDRFCSNCGHELSPEDQFCPNCARPVHETATVPTPEADVPVPPPPQTGGAGGAATPQQPAQEGGGERRWRPILVGCLGVFVVLVAAIISFVIGDLYGKGLLGCNETAAEQKGPKGEIGQTVKFSNVAWQVTSARQATELKAPRRYPSYPKKIGNFVIVDFLFTNNADEATTLDTGSLTLLDGEGCEFEMQPNEFEYIDPEVYLAPGKDIFTSENVNPGVTKDGQVIFAVTPDAKDFTLRASDTDPFITDENAYIELGF